MKQEEIIRLRELLSRFYDGTDTHAERMEALCLLDTPDLPEEFAGEAEVLRAMTADAPAGLEKMLHATDCLVSDLARKRRRRVWRVIGISVASAAAVLALILPFAGNKRDFAPELNIALPTAQNLLFDVDSGVSDTAGISVGEETTASVVADRLSDNADVKSAEKESFIKERRSTSGKISGKRRRNGSAAVSDTIPGKEELEFARIKIAKACAIYKGAVADAKKSIKESGDALEPAYPYILN